MAITVKNMLDEAFARVSMVESEKAMTWVDDPETVFVDVRDGNSIKATGKIKAAIHVERGLLDFFLIRNIRWES